MKLQAKQRLQSFQLIRQDMAPKPDVAKRLGERYKDELEWVHGGSTDPRLTIGYLNYEGKQLTFYIFYDDVCQGNVVFDFMEGRKIATDARLKLTNVATPHSVLDSAVRSKGLVSFLYRQALARGISLVSDAHTEMASSLWEHLGKQFNLYHFEEGKVIPEMTRTSIKILTKRKIHG